MPVRALAMLAVLIAAPAPAIAQDAAPLVLTEAQDGSSESVTVGSKIEVRLSLSAGTGYDWKQTSEADGLKPGDPRSAPAAAANGRPVMGGKMVATFPFVAKAPGSYTLRFALARPWETGVEPAKTVSFTIDVTE